MNWKPSNSSFAVVANGEIRNFKLIASRIQTYPTRIAVDGGLHHLDHMGLSPDLITGDFDSVDPKLLKQYTNVTQIRMADEDKTDLEKTLEFLFTYPVTEINVFAALGNRIDHTLANLILLSRFPGKVFFETETERAFVIDREVALSVHRGQTLSLIPLNGQVSGITSSGLKWELKNAILHKYFVGISNVCLQERISIRVEKGDLLCCIVKSMYTHSK